MGSVTVSAHALPERGASGAITTISPSGRRNLINSHLTDPSQLVNLDELARVAKKYGLKVKVTGAADSATGTIGINNALSASRADYIASELNKRGLPSDRITKTGEGGISDYVPTEANRHSKVELFFDKLEKTEIHP